MSGRQAPPRLGRGLAALIADMAPLDGKNSSHDAVRMLDLSEVSPGNLQPRHHADAESLDELAASIRTRGILQPVLVRPHPTDSGRYEIIAGERRWRAAHKAGLSKIPALVRNLTELEALAAALVENLQREDLNAIEEAEGYRRLRDEFGLTQESLAEAVGKSRSHVANITRLLRLPPSVQQDVRRGALTAGHARALLAHHQPEKAALAVISRGLNVRQTEQLTTSTIPKTKSDRTTRRAQPDHGAVEQQLTEHLGLKVDIATHGRGGTLKLHYASFDQLEGLVRLLTQ